MALMLTSLSAQGLNLLQPTRPYLPAKASAGAPGSKSFCYGLPGNFNALTGETLDFDPFGFTAGKSALEVNRFREAELTHGRVAMLASLGFIVQEKFHPLFSGVGGPAIDQIPQLPVWLWVVMTGGLGFAPLGFAPTDPAEFRIMQTKELMHCRVAMLAAAGFLAQEAVTGATWGTALGAPDF